MSSKSSPTAERAEILERYLEATDPAERRRLLRAWLAAGGRELLDQAVSDGLKPLRHERKP